MQKAGTIFGCSAILHNIDTGGIPRGFPENEHMLAVPFHAPAADAFTPLVVSSYLPQDFILRSAMKIDAAMYPLHKKKKSAFLLFPERVICMKKLNR